jgi:hypothetical protein
MLLTLLIVFIQQCPITELVVSIGNASHATDRVYTTMPHHRASWLYR